MISSAIPSAKNSCSGSPDMLTKGRTAIDGLSGSGSTPSAPAVGIASAVASVQRYIRTGSGMFLTSRSPMSSKAIESLFLTSS